MATTKYVPTIRPDELGPINHLLTYIQYTAYPHMQIYNKICGHALSIRQTQDCTPRNHPHLPQIGRIFLQLPPSWPAQTSLASSGRLDDARP